jgi:hypothetical protein
MHTVHKPRAPKLLVNDIGGIYRLEGGLIQVTFIQKFEDHRRNAIEQGSLIWPEQSFHQSEHLMRWAVKEIARGTFSRNESGPLLRAH